MKYEVGNGRCVTESALIARINKKLIDESQDRKEVQMTGSPSIGHFFGQEDEHVGREDTIDLESIGRELDVLAPDESIARREADRSPETERPIRRSILW